MVNKVLLKEFLFVFIAFSFSLNAFAQIDVQHYRFEIELADHTDAINGKAIITVKLLEDASEVQFDLASLEDEKGMYAFQVKDGSELVKAFHRDNVLKIPLLTVAKKGEIRTFEINYMGTPKDGLIISKNRHGDRTFFSDNWPNRAHNWIPSNDVPSDKASVEFVVTAPAHYSVVSNGIKLEEVITGNKKRTHWKEELPLPTKIMVIGVAKFVVKQFNDSPSSIPVSAWVYPQDSVQGFYDYGVATEALKYFSNYIAPYPYKKLANVQSTTIFGGMENASAIFYAEKLISGKRETEDLIAHEIAHQWFGNMATEKNFSHLWLSEGFADYLENMYMEQKYGKAVFQKRMAQERSEIIDFVKTSKNPVVDSSVDYMGLLNANSYQKGAWILHMLRGEVGDSVFQKIIQTYYAEYKGSNADSRDFETIAEKVSEKELTPFFNQWLYQPGIPKLNVKWKGENDKLKVEIKQSGNFSFPLELVITTADGKQIFQTIPVGKETEFKIETKSKPVKLALDPNVTALFEATVTESK